MKVYRPPLLLQNPLMLTLAVAWGYQAKWLREHPHFLDSFRDHRFLGADQVPLYGLYKIPASVAETPKGTVIATYGITGNLRDLSFRICHCSRLLPRQFPLTLVKRSGQTHLDSLCSP